MSKSLKLSSGSGGKILAVLLICGFILGGTVYYYAWYAPQRQQNQENLLAVLGFPTGGSVYVLSAGSLSSVLNNASQQFEALHPGVNIYIVYYGSVECADLIKQGTPCDLFFSADFYVIQNMLYQTPIPKYYNLVNYTDWWVNFATNTLCIAYTTNGPNHLTLSNTTWYQDLNSGVGLWARSNPDLDPAGYRALIMLNISDTYYPANPTEYPLYPTNPSNSSQGTLLAEVESNPSWITITAKSANIIPLLQAGDIDAGFVYVSNAIQAGLPYITLPNNVSLGYQPYNAWYSEFSVTPTTTTYWGSWIQYGATIPNTASISDTYWATQFLSFVLSSQGQAILTAGYQPVINPPVAEGSWSAVPSQIQSLCTH
jgi:tungstate ABC transporter binding protein WtpA